MITNLPPPGGVSPHQPSHHGSTPESAVPPCGQDSFSQFEDDFQTPPQQSSYPPQHQHYQHQYYPQYPQYPQQQQQQPQVPHWHHQHGYYNPYPQQQHQQPTHQTYPNYSPSDPSSTGGYIYPHHQSNGYYEQQHPNGGGIVPGSGGQSTHNCTPSPLANSDDSGGDCVNESKGSQAAALQRGPPGPAGVGILPLIPRPKGPRPTTSVMSAKRGGKRARQRDPNEPQKPVSAYALFFRDVQAGIKQRNPAASFGEVSKHVAALWDGMDPDSKGAYKRRTEQAKKEYLRQLAAYRATLVSKGNTLENPYNGKGLEVVTKVGEERNYLMSQRMTESSGYGSNSSTTLTPLGSGPTPSSPQSTMGQSPNNGYHLNQLHIRHMPPDTRYPGASFQQSDPGSGYDQDVMMSNCKRPGCPNPIRMNNSRPMPEYCSNDCLVNDNNNKQLFNNSWTPEQQQPPPQPQQTQPPQQSPTSEN